MDPHGAWKTNLRYCITMVRAALLWFHRTEMVTPCNKLRAGLFQNFLFWILLVLLCEAAMSCVCYLVTLLYDTIQCSTTTKNGDC